MCFKNPLSSSSYKMPRKDSDDTPQPAKVSGFFAMRLIELEISLEQNCTLSLIHQLTALYTEAIEFFDDKDDPKCFDIQQRMHKMLSRPDVIAVLHSPPNEVGADSHTSYENQKSNFEESKKTMAVTLKNTLKPRINHTTSSSDLLEDHTNKIQEIITQLSEGFEIQEKSLEKRLDIRRKSMLNRSHSISNSSYIGECDMSAGRDNELIMEKEIEEFLENNFAMQAAAVVEINVKYENEIKQLDGQGGVLAMVVNEMRKNKEAEVGIVKAHFEKLRRDEISTIKKKHLVRG